MFCLFEILRSWSLHSGDGDKYDGEFKDDTYNGHGVYDWANDTKYDGEFKDGKRHGRGVTISADGIKSEREWKDDEPVL